MPLGAARLGFWKNPPPIPQDYFLNSGFESGIEGWTFISDRVFLNGVTTILGYPVPPDSGIIPTTLIGSVSSGDATITNPITFVNTTTTLYASSGTSSIILSNQVTSTGEAGGILYGPVIYSNGRINARTGDVISFDWRAISSINSGYSDAYKIFAYLIDSATGEYIVLLDEFSQRHGVDTGWQHFEKTIESDEEGNYHFVFINGSWDSTFGFVIGAEFYLDNVEFTKAS